MAQRKTHGRGGFGRRVGRLGSKPVVIACAVLLAAACGTGAALTLRSSGGIELVRAEDSAPQVVEGGDATGGAGDASGDVAAGATDGTGETVVVHVDGAVVAPGVYELSGASPRVGDAVDAAGGLAEGADTSGINLAAKVADGTKVHVPVVGEATTSAGQQEGAGTVATAADGSASGSDGSGSALVNINTAGPEELQTLSGVGEATASAIIEDRERNGPFKSIEDIMRVSGIGEKKFAKIQGSICV